MRYILSIFLIFAIFGSSVADELRKKKIKILAEAFRNVRIQRELKKRNLQEAQSTSVSNSTEPEDNTNATEPIKEVDPESPVSTKGTPTGNPTKNLQIVKFHNFQATSKKAIRFGVFFFFFKKKVANIVRFRLRVTQNSRRIRSLADESVAESVPTTCTVKIPALADTIPEDGKNIDYDCSANTEKVDARKATVALNTDVAMELEDKSGQKETLGFENLNFKGNSSEESSNLQNAEKMPDKSVDLNDIEFLSSDKTSFRIKGIADPKNVFKQDDKIPFKVQNRQSNGQLVAEEIICTVESTSSSSGETVLDCAGDANTDMKNINSLTGSNGDYSLTLYVKDWQNTDTQIITGKYNTNDPSNNIMYRKDSSGLSGGAIAGIVIACVVVLAAASIAAIMLRKPTPPIDNTTVVGLKTVDNI
jgi:hypothetical protein